MTEIENSEWNPAQQELECRRMLMALESDVVNRHRDEFERRYSELLEAFERARIELLEPCEDGEKRERLKAIYDDYSDRWSQAHREFAATKLLGE